VTLFHISRWRNCCCNRVFLCIIKCLIQSTASGSSTLCLFLKSPLALLCDSNKPNPNQISMTNGKIATVNGAGPGAFHAAGGGRACESCYSEFYLFVRAGVCLRQVWNVITGTANIGQLEERQTNAVPCRALLTRGEKLFFKFHHNVSVCCGSWWSSFPSLSIPLID